MAINATLKFNDKPHDVYHVIQCDYDFRQDIDASGKPSASPRSGTVNVIVETISDKELVTWMFAPDSIRSGEIIFYKADGTRLKRLEFYKAYCIHYEERFSHHGQNPMLTSFSFVAGELNLNEVSYPYKK